MQNSPAASESVFIEEAARLICEDGYASYRKARRKAAEQLGMQREVHGVNNIRIEAAVLKRQALFGGAAYRARLSAMRRLALRIMKLLSGFEPRLAGSAVSGAIGAGHRLQIHVVADQPETVEMRLHDRGIAFGQGERRYRFTDGRERPIALLSLDVDGFGADLAVFGLDDARNPPLSQIDNKPMRRLLPVQIQQLLGATDTAAP